MGEKHDVDLDNSLQSSHKAYVEGLKQGRGGRRGRGKPTGSRQPRIIQKVGVRGRRDEDEEMGTEGESDERWQERCERVRLGKCPAADEVGGSSVKRSRVSGAILVDNNEEDGGAEASGSY